MDHHLALFLTALERGPQTLHARGRSMQPAIPDGTPLLLTRRADKEPPLQAVVAVAPGPLIVHRVVGRRATARGPAFLLQGDAHSQPDGWFAAEDILAWVCHLDGRPIAQALPPPPQTLRRILWQTARGRLRLREPHRSPHTNTPDRPFA